MMNELTTVTFNGGSFLTTEIDGVPHVAMRPVVRNVGLAWQPQNRKMVDNARWKCRHMVSPDLRGRPQKMIALPVDQLPDWFHNINTAKIPDPEIRESILLYQQEGCRALNDYWRKGYAKRPDVDDRDDLIRELMTLVRNQGELLASQRNELARLSGEVAQLSAADVCKPYTLEQVKKLLKVENGPARVGVTITAWWLAYLRKIKRHPLDGMPTRFERDLVAQWILENNIELRAAEWCRRHVLKNKELGPRVMPLFEGKVERQQRLYDEAMKNQREENGNLGNDIRCGDQGAD